MAPQPGKHLNEEDDPEKLSLIAALAKSLTTSMPASPVESPRSGDDDDMDTDSEQSPTEMSENGRPTGPPGPPGQYQSYQSLYGHSRTRYPPTTTTMETSASQYPDLEKSTSTGGLIAVSTGIVPETPPNGPVKSDSPDKDGLSKGEMMTAAAGVPIVMLLIIGVVVFFCMRKRKKQKRIAAAQAQAEEMKMRQRPIVHSYMAPPAGPPPAPYPGPPTHLPLSSSPAMPEPVILGPIPAGSNGAYFTGIDTSDVVSVNENQLHHNERTGLGDPFADNNSLQDEPPPPYRPRSIAPPSIAPSSRHASLRVPPPAASAATSQTHLIPGSHQQQHPPPRSPFADPLDDDAVSELGSPNLTARRGGDAMSDVSDLSYQAEPVISHRAV